MCEYILFVTCLQQGEKLKEMFIDTIVFHRKCFQDLQKSYFTVILQQKQRCTHSDTPSHTKRTQQKTKVHLMKVSFQEKERLFTFRSLRQHLVILQINT